MSLDLKVGQKVFWVWGHNHRGLTPEWVHVTKVGRVWATLDNGFRVSLKNGRGDGGEYVSPGSIYLTQEEYQSEVEHALLWSQLIKKFDDLRYRRPSHRQVSAGKLRSIINILEDIESGNAN